MVDGFGQGGIPQKIRMNQQHPTRTLGGRGRVGFNAEHLSGGDKEHDPFVEIIHLLAVLELGRNAPLDGNLIKIQHPAHRTHFRRTPNGAVIDHTNERVFGFGQASELVKLGNGFNALNTRHKYGLVISWTR